MKGTKDEKTDPSHGLKTKPVRSGSANTVSPYATFFQTWNRAIYFTCQVLLGCRGQNEQRPANVQISQYIAYSPTSSMGEK